MNTIAASGKHQHHQGDEHQAEQELADVRRADAQERSRACERAARLTRGQWALDKAHARLTRASRTRYAAALC